MPGQCLVALLAGGIQLAPILIQLVAIEPPVVLVVPQVAGIAVQVPFIAGDVALVASPGGWILVMGQVALGARQVVFVAADVSLVAADGSPVLSEVATLGARLAPITIDLLLIFLQGLVASRTGRLRAGGRRFRAAAVLAGLLLPTGLLPVAADETAPGAAPVVLAALGEPEPADALPPVGALEFEDCPASAWSALLAGGIQLAPILIQLMPIEPPVVFVVP